MKANFRLAAEAWLSRKLERPALFLGVTTADDRRNRLRNEIVSRGLVDADLGVNKLGQRETFGECFARIYAQPIQAEPTTLDLLEQLHQPTGENNDVGTK